LLTARIVAVATVLVLLAVAQQQGVFHRFASPAQATRTLQDLGPWGYVAFIVAYTILQPFGVPGTVFIFAAPLIWPWPVAFALSMVGTMSASVVGFSFARFVARDWVSGLVPARFKRYEDALARRGFRTVFVLRFIFWMPPLLHAFFGVSRVPFWTHFWASLAGYVLPLLLVSYFGQTVYDALRNAPVGVWIAIGAGVAAVWIGAWLVHRRRAALPGTG
jgi:uncharacterized membrane protein YdjX (TVP38/TMEM64 family)